MRFGGAIVLMSLLLAGCQTVGGGSGPSASQVVSELGSVPAGQVVNELEKRGFKRLSDRALKGRVGGKTLKIAQILGYFGNNMRVRIKTPSLGGMESKGTWRIENSVLCHAVGSKHEFCNALFFRGDEVLCWPGLGRAAVGTSALQECQILPGNATSGYSVADVVKGMRKVPAADVVRQMSKRGFVRLSNRDLKGRISGKYLKMASTSGFYGTDQTVHVSASSLGSGVESTGTWQIKESALCLSVRADHEFCNGLFFRGDKILCWPGVGNLTGATELRECRVTSGQKPTVVASRAITSGTVTRPVVAQKKPEPALDNSPMGLFYQEMQRQGFSWYSDDVLLRRVAGGTLELAGTQAHYGKGNQVNVTTASLGGGMESRGTWRVAGPAICHSVHEGREFCTGLFFRGAEVWCWPGLGQLKGDLNRLTECRILPGTTTNVLSIDAVVAGLRGIPANALAREMAKHGFVPLPDSDLRKWLAGKTLRLAGSSGYFETLDRVRIRGSVLGGTFESIANWRTNNSAVCHSLGQGPEVCNALFVRGKEVLCRPEANPAAPVSRCEVVDGG